MKRSCSRTLHLSSAAAAAASTRMSSRTSFRGGRSWGRSRRNYSDRSSSDGGDSPQQFVTGDSHFRQVRDANRGFRPPYNRGNSNSSNFQPSPNFTPRPRPQQPTFSNFNRPPPPAVDQNQQAYRQPQPRYGDNQQFRQRCQPQQQFRPPPSRVPKDLEYRKWEYAKPGPTPECERFTILSYNILADYLARDHRHKLYFHIPAYMMDWQWRKRSIVFELGLWSADILCFQSQQLNVKILGIEAS